MGYKVNEYFKTKHISNATIAASGDIRCLGVCPIEIKNPFSSTPLASFTTLHKNQGISTSGNYNNFEDTPANNHLINPKTLKPQLSFISITLTGTIRSSDLDAYATAASVMPITKAYSFLDSQKLAYLVLQSNGETRYQIK
jgi:thiamine biosynthesis lipoprotein ApbE